MTTPELNFATPAQLLAALPHLLGFVPAEDLVTLMCGPSPSPRNIALRAVIRCPITLTDTQAQRFPQTCQLTATQFPTAVLVAVASEHHAEHAMATLHIVRAALQQRGIAVLRILHTQDLTQPGHWVDATTGQCGNTIAYTDSPATALGVLQGRVIAPSRSDMHREFATTATAPRLDAEAQDIPALFTDTAHELRQTITGGGQASPQLASRAAVLVTAHIGLRDALLRLAAGHELAAAGIWTHLAAQHRGRTRAELLTMAAASYYAGEDTARAGTALMFADNAAREEDATVPTLATMLRTALHAGLPPARLRDIILSPDKAPGPRADR